MVSSLENLGQKHFASFFQLSEIYIKFAQNKDNYYVLQGAKDSTKIHPMMIEKLIDFFEADPKRFDELYFT